MGRLRRGNKNKECLFNLEDGGLRNCLKRLMSLMTKGSDVWLLL